MKLLAWPSLAALVLLAAAGARADVPPPPKRTPKNAPGNQLIPRSTTFPVELVRIKNDEPVRIEIPRAAVNPVPAGAAGTMGTFGSGDGALRTLIAGLSLSAGLTLGGLWLARRRRRLALGTLAAGTGAAALAVLVPGPAQANLAPFPVPASKVNAQVRVVERGRTIRLFLSPQAIAALTEEEKPARSVPPTGAAPKN